MATLSKREGWYSVRFIFPAGQRHTLALGTRSDRQATTFKTRLENLISARKSGVAPEPETVLWIGGLADDAREKLADAGLLEAQGRKSQVPTLEQFLERYLNSRTDVKEPTRVNWGHTKRNLLEFFGTQKRLDEVTAGDAKDFERFLKTTARENRYADADKKDALSADTIRKRIGNAKLFFNDAVERRLIKRNPFAKLKSAVQGNRDRDFFVTRDMATKLIAAAPNAQWRLVIALSRYGGLRCPSEHVQLLLDDVDWERDRIRVTSPKTEHHVGKAWRHIPLFPELRPYLEEVWHAAEPGEKYFVTLCRSAEQNLRTGLLRIIEKAGLTPWPKLFQNMRASRQTELEEQFPSHVVCAWIGNSPQVAKKHYLQVTDEHFKRGARSIFVATDASQSIPTAEPDVEKALENRDVLQSVATPMGVTGLEPVTSTV